MKKVLIIGFILVFILSSFFVSANHREDIKDERFYFNKLFNNLWGKITGNPIFQRISKVGSVESASIKESPPENSFRRGLPFKTQSARTDSTSQESIQIQPAESNQNQKSKEIKKLTSNLLELNNKYLSPIKSREKKNILSELEKSAIEREKEMIELAKQNPILFLNNVLSKEERNLFPDKIKEYIEEEVIIEGDLLTLHIDDFKDINNPISKFEYFIITEDNEKINFYPLVSLDFVPEAKVKIIGYQLNENIVGSLKEIQTKKEVKVDEGIAKNIQPPPSKIPKPIIPEEHKIAVILVNFLDSPPSPFTPAEAHELIFNGQFQNFYREQSYNKIYFSGDVFGWYTLPRNTHDRGCFPSVGWQGELDEEITNNNLPLENFDHLLILSNGVGCSGGMANIGEGNILINNQKHNISIFWVSADGTESLSSSYWSPDYPPSFAWTNLDFVLSHEMGHSLGLLHAEGYDCGELPFLNNDLSNCKRLNYGNLFDIMGVGRGYSFHLNAFYKEILGWISPQDSISITQSGTYTINALETSQGKKFAKIKMLGNVAPILNAEKILKSYYPYYLEYRKGMGFDDTLNNQDLSSNQEGLLINTYWGGHMPGYLPSTNLLDMNATLFDWQEDLKSASLSGNDIFSDPLTGITIGPIINFTATSISFNVSLQKTTCVRKQPLINIKSESEGISAGNLGMLYFAIFNTDYPACDFSKFRITTTGLPQGFSYFMSERDIFPLESSYFGTYIQTSPTLCTGSHPITFSVENLNSGLITTETIYVKITGTTPCLPEVAPPEF